MRLHTLENLNVAKTVSGMFMFMHFYRLFELGAEFVVFVPSYAFNP